ncbi:MAG: DUF429 domain-containing protein, partial [Deinococcus-Thermus bacterium]|nr:DUF429 domain-containing protein [Deinococcota bacterium]
RPEDGPRPPDRAARALLAARNADGLRGVGSRVFAAPSRAHLALWRAGGDYAALRAAFPPPHSLSKQCWNICGKIAELDALLGADPDAGLWEAHPEIAFADLAGRTLAAKKSVAGAEARRAALAAEGFNVLRLIDEAGGHGAGWSFDDLLDACALVCVADRIASGRHTGLPNLTDRDSLGLRRAIVY